MKTYKITIGDYDDPSVYYFKSNQTLSRDELYKKFEQSINDYLDNVIKDLSDYKPNDFVSVQLIMEHIEPKFFIDNGLKPHKEEITENLWLKEGYIYGSPNYYSNRHDIKLLKSIQDRAVKIEDKLGELNSEFEG